MLKKILKIAAVSLLLLIIVAAIFIGMNYHADMDYSELKDKYSHANSRFTEIKGMPVHYSIEGKGKKTLLLLHGTGGSLHDWNQWMPAFENDFKIIRLDLPGFGLTGPNPQNRYDRIFYQVFLESFVDRLGLRDFHIAGNSFGGFLAWNYALENPGKVDKLVLLNSSGYPRGNKALPIGFRLAQNENLAPIISKITPRFLIKKTILDAYEDDSKVSEELVDRFFELLLREGNRDAMFGKMQQIKTDNWQQIKKIKVPTLIMWGDRDEIVPVGDAYRFHKDIAHSEFVMYENIGHMPMEEIPVQSAKDVLEFLDKGMAGK